MNKKLLIKKIKKDLKELQKAANGLFDTQQDTEDMFLYLEGKVAAYRRVLELIEELK